MPKNVLDFNAITSAATGGVGSAVGGILGLATGTAGQIIDGATAFLGRSISLRLISASKTDGLLSLSLPIIQLIILPLLSIFKRDIYIKNIYAFKNPPHVQFSMLAELTIKRE